MEDNPILNRSEAFEDIGPIPSCRPTAKPAKKSVPSATKRLILELGLRYRPGSTDALEGHQAKLTALMLDLADIPPAALERAIGRWVMKSPYLPKASELVELARDTGDHSADRNSRENAQKLANLANARLAAEGKRHMHWIVDGNDLKLETV